MSVEASKPVEETPVTETTTKPLPEQPEAATAPVDSAAAPAETTETAPAEDAAATEEPAAPATEEVKKDETPAAPVPASEGVLGYKEPTLFKKFFFTKHYFWFSEEPSTPESLATFLRSEKADAKHSTAAWARETGKGLLFFAKRVEDKVTPVGIINLAEASTVTKESYNQFAFKAGSQHHRFETTKTDERDSWVVAIENAIEEAKGLKEEIIGRESYKKNVEEYSKPAIVTPAAATATKTPRSKSKEPKKSLDITAAASAAATAPVAERSSSTSNSSDEATKAKKERSQSRKRGSIFGTLLGKKEELAEKKEEKAEAKKEVKEEKKAEAEDKKEEAQAAEEPSTAVEAGEAAAVAAAAAPVAAVATDKKEDKEEAAPTDKKAKRASVFGNFFKHRVTSPTSEKTEKEATASSDVPPVSETAPKLEEPIENKPINTADVTAPVDAETAAAPAEEPAKDATAAPAEASSAPKAEKKGGFIGFIKKTEAKLEGKKEPKEEAKEEAKEETAADAIVKDPVAAASTEPTESAVVEPAAETKEERPARDNKRRTSLFFNKKRTETSDAEDPAEPKREKSPLPGKLIGNLVRRASKAVKSEGPKDKPATAAEPATEAAATEPSAHQATTVSETPAPVAEATEPSQISGDVVPEDLVSKTEPATTGVPVAPEVKASA